MKINEVAPIYPKQLHVSEDKLITIIKTHCSEFIPTLLSSGPLYRGITNEYIPIFIASARDYRRPKDTYIKYQEAIDNKLKDAGFTALRGNSIFVTGEKYAALNYGSVYYIFPLNGFTCTWGLSYDLTSDFALNAENWNYCEEMDELQPTDEQIKKSLKTSHHRMYFDLQELTLEEFVKKYEFHNNEYLGDAITTGREIYIRGQYIAVNLVENKINFLEELK